MLAVPTFSDGFETGDLSAWTGTLVSGGCSVAVNSTIFNEGSYSVKSILDAWTNNAVVYKTFGAGSTFYGRCYVYLENLADSDSREIRYLMFGTDGVNYQHFSIGIDMDNTYKWVLGYTDNGVAQEEVLNTDNPVINTWYCIELYAKVDGANGAAKFYLDGVEKLSVSGKDTDNWGNIDRVQVGQRQGDGAYVKMTAFIDDVVVDTSYIGLTNTAPSNADCDVYNADDTDDLYAQYRTYVVTANVTDVDGFADLVTVDLTLQTGAAVERVTFRYTEATNAFSELSGATTAWELVTASCTQTKAGDDIDLTFYFRAEWDATEESDLDLKIVSTDAAAATDTDTYDVNLDVITNLLATSLEGNDADNPDRQSINSTPSILGSIRYASEPASAVASTYYPPDAEFTSIALHDSNHVAEATNASVTNGDATLTFTLNATVCSDTYHLYVAMADADYTDADEAAVTETIIQDQVKILTLVENRTHLESGTTNQYNATAELSYDAHPLGAGDSFILEGVTFTWDAVSSTFGATKTDTGPLTFVIDEWTSGTEATYGITAGTINGLSVNAAWDKPPTGTTDPETPDPPTPDTTDRNTVWWNKYGTQFIIATSLIILAFTTTKTKKKKRSGGIDKILKKRKLNF